MTARKKPSDKNVAKKFEPIKGKKYFFKDSDSDEQYLYTYIGKFENLYLVVEDEDLEGLRDNCTVGITPFEECIDVQVYTKEQATKELERIIGKKVVIE